MVFGDERRTGLHGPEELPLVDVTQEQLRDRFSEWVELAKQHAGELVVIHKDGRHDLEYWPVHMGVIRANLDMVEKTEGGIDFSGTKFTDAPTVASDSGSVRESDLPLQINTIQVYDSFQLVKPSFLSREGVPQFQIVSGNREVAEWFSKNGHLRGVTMGKYVEMARRLGVEPIITPEVEAYVVERRQVIIKDLVDLALKRAGVKRKIEAVYGSVGGGAQSLHGGLAIGMPPESVGQANLRTHGDRREMDAVGGTVQRLTRELIDLGVDESDYYRIIAQQLGLDLPTKQDEPAAE